MEDPVSWFWQITAAKTTRLRSQRILANILSHKNRISLPLFLSPSHPAVYIQYILFHSIFFNSVDVTVIGALSFTDFFFSEAVKLSDRLILSVAFNNFHVHFISHLLPPSSVSFSLSTEGRAKANMYL